MKENLKTYQNRIAKLKHRLKLLYNNINDFKELNKEIKRLNKIIKYKTFKKQLEK